ncbi:head-tail connector protein [Govanella unica]|uniref:Head-tail connector protein n=1 Tax=Govanella unica TaxID=2975056 RepID=A0A9X3TZR6_9PROT|nr:head-tail connector protein [Govania unica]MDA5194946.1 head-tail connector protein [Govania unica]
MSNLLLLSGPAVEPLTLDEVKLHLRVDGCEEDGLLSACITAARRSAEAYLRRALIAQRWQYYLDDWPGVVLRIPCPPLRTVDMIRIYDGDGAVLTMDPDRYEVDCRSEPGRIAARGGIWPAPGRRMGGIEITFEAGYGTSWNAVPQDIRAGLLMAVAAMYEQRGATDGGLPPSIAALWSPYRMLSF